MRYWLLGTGYWALVAGCWVYWLTGLWLLVDGYWLLGTGCWSLVIRLERLDGLDR